MQISIPWILSRKRLLAAVIADGVLFGFLYYALYGWRFGFWPLFARLAVLLTIWSLARVTSLGAMSGDRRFLRMKPGFSPII